MKKTKDLFCSRHHKTLLTVAFYGKSNQKASKTHKPPPIRNECFLTGAVHVCFVLCSKQESLSSWTLALYRSRLESRWLDLRHFHKLWFLRHMVPYGSVNLVDLKRLREMIVLNEIKGLLVVMQLQCNISHWFYSHKNLLLTFSLFCSIVWVHKYTCNENQSPIVCYSRTKTGHKSSPNKTHNRLTTSGTILVFWWYSLLNEKLPNEFFIRVKLALGRLVESHHDLLDS